MIVSFKALVISKCLADQSEEDHVAKTHTLCSMVFFKGLCKYLGISHACEGKTFERESIVSFRLSFLLEIVCMLINVAVDRWWST